eukprot:gene11391-921_t
MQVGDAELQEQPEKLSRFTLLRYLGGVSASVFCAEHEGRVAAKQLAVPVDKIPDPNRDKTYVGDTFIRLYNAELRNVVRPPPKQHPNVVRVHTALLDSDGAVREPDAECGHPWTIWMLMEYVAGGTLRAALDERPGPVPVAAVAGLMYQLLAALAHLQRSHPPI